MAEKVLIYDAWGVPVTNRETPPTVDQADIGRVQDPWSGHSTGGIDPSKLASTLKGTADLSTQMAVIKQIADDPHVASCMRNLAHAIGRLDWEMQPWDEKSRAAKKEAEEQKNQLKSLRWFKKFLKHLVFGELYPFVAAGLRWQKKTYKPGGFTIVDPVRWTWERKTRQLYIKTLRNPMKGEPVEENAFCFHSSALEPGDVREAGLWRKIAWLWLYTQSSWEYRMTFAQNFGQPYIWAFFKRGDDPQKVLDAVVSMAGNARGVFPEGTDVKLQEAQRYSSIALFKEIETAAHELMTKVIQGHVLNTDAKSGAGTLAGNHAEKVSQENKEGVAEGLSESVQEGLIRPYNIFKRGRGVVEAEEIPIFSIVCKPPVDLNYKAQTYVQVNTGLSVVGEAIDPEQWREEFGVRTVKRTAADPNNPQQPKSDDEKKKEKAARAAASRENAPALANTDALAEMTKGLLRTAAAELSSAFLAKVESASSLEELRDVVLWESYDEHNEVVAKAASFLTDATAIAELMGRGDAAHGA